MDGTLPDRMPQRSHHIHSCFNRTSMGSPVDVRQETVLGIRSRRARSASAIILIGNTGTPITGELDRHKQDQNAHTPASGIDYTGSSSPPCD